MLSVALNKAFRIHYSLFSNIHFTLISYIFFQKRIHRLKCIKNIESITKPGLTYSNLNSLSNINIAPGFAQTPTAIYEVHCSQDEGIIRYVISVKGNSTFIAF